MIDDGFEEAEFGETQWTDGAREAFRSATDDLIDRLRAHADLLCGATRPSSGEIFASSDALDRAASGLANAQFDLSGTFALLDLDGEDEEEDKDDYEDDDEEAGDPDRDAADVISVFRRLDLRVDDADAVRRRARSLWLESYPDASEDELARYTTRIALALHQIVHHDGWGALESADGVQPLAAVSAFVSAGSDEQETLDVLEDFDPTDPAPAFELRGAVLFTTSDSWVG